MVIKSKTDSKSSRRGKNMIKISVIIVTYNSEKHIYDCLDSVLKYNDIGRELEILIVDNCSREYDTLKANIIERYGDAVRIIQNKKNGGYGQGNNVGIEHSLAPIVMIMNPDVRLCEPLFSTVLEEFKRNINLVQYGMTQIMPSGKIGRSTGWSSTVNPFFAEPLRYLFGRLNLFYPKYMYVSGACFFVKKDSFISAGLFDDNIFMYCEEEDIHRRLRKIKDAKIKYSRRIKYFHCHEAVADYSNESYNWINNNLNSLLYMNQRDGLSIHRTLIREIKRTDFILFVEKCRKYIGKQTKGKYDYFLEWKRYLSAKLDNDMSQ